MLSIGSQAPALTLVDDADNKVTLADYTGRHVVLYAYPKDDTPGCTTEACSFRDNSDAIGATGAVILGISPDSPASHRKFKEKYHLKFTLLSDPDHKMLEALGAWGEKVSYGKTSIGVIRSTFVFDPSGKLVKVWPKVSVQTHGEEIATFLREG